MAKGKRKTLSMKEEEYNLKYGALPKTQEELLQYAQEKYPFSQDQFDKAMDMVEDNPWRRVEFTLYLVPTPTPRPRYDGNHFYVKGAAQNKKLIKQYIERHILFTRCEITIEAYLPTPTSVMNHAEIYLCEGKLIVPVGSCDVDNLMKTYLDMIQGHLLLNDNIVTMGHLEKYYSLKPRLHIIIRYQEKFDSKYNQKKITRSRAYQEEFNS